VIGEIIFHYEILEKLGEGGMGVVYKARDTSLNRLVALKFLPSHLTKDESTRKRFIVEAQAASALDHPNICNIHEINETPDGQLYICMAYYEGKSLREKIDKGPIPFDETIKLFSQIAQGLKTAHEKNIIHRDIKPGNILLTEKGEVKIVDFGLAKLAGVDLTKTTSSKGTAAYMCPEQIRGQKVDHRCDIWALGIVLYEMLTGHLPFEGEYPEPMMYAITNTEPKPLSDYLKNGPEYCQNIIDKLLKKDPDERYSDISEILFDFKNQIKTDDFVELKSKPALKKTARRKNIYAYISVIVVLVLLYLLKPYFLQKQSEEIKIAVLPAESIGGNPEQERFNVSMTEELITKLGQISGLRVTGGFSSKQYLGTTKTTPQIASELDVQYILQISSSIDEDQVYLKPRLLDAKMDEYILMQEYKRNIKNVLGLQGLIVKEITDKIGVKPTADEEARLSEKREVNPETYRLYMDGIYYIYQKTPDGLVKGLELLRQAVENDPNEPLAHANYALGLCEMAHSPKPMPGAAKTINESALKALEFDNNIAEAHLALAMVKIYSERDIIGAGQSYRRALECKPDFPQALYHNAFYQLLMGNLEEGSKSMKKAIELEPLDPFYSSEMALWYYVCEDFDNAMEYAEMAFALDPNDSHTLFILGEVLAAKGMYDKAIEVQKIASELNFYFEFSLAQTYALAGKVDEAYKIAEKIEERNDIFDTWCLAVIYGALRDADNMFFWLNQAEQRNHVWIMWIRRGDVFFGAFKDDPRFQALLEKLNLPK
jgi:serine/threonine protein kinase/Tfp pilus assembly protein PilF